MEEDDLLSYYIEIGAVGVSGIMEDGEFIYEIMPEAKEIAPELWQAHTEYVDDSLLTLFNAGLINISYDENLEALIQLSEEGYNQAIKMGLIPKNK